MLTFERSKNIKQLNYCCLHTTAPKSLKDQRSPGENFFRVNTNIFIRKQCKIQVNVCLVVPGRKYTDVSPHIARTSRAFLQIGNFRPISTGNRLKSTEIVSWAHISRFGCLGAIMEGRGRRSGCYVNKIAECTKIHCNYGLMTHTPYTDINFVCFFQINKHLLHHGFGDKRGGARSGLFTEL